jgi:hypothetical protein
MKLLIGNDQTIEVQSGGLTDAVTGDPINDATVTATIRDRAGNAVGGVTWPITLDYIAASDGQYRGNIPAAAEFAASKRYQVTVDAVSPTHGTARWTQWVPALYRTLVE